MSLVLYYDLPLNPSTFRHIRLKKTIHVSKGGTAWLTNQKTGFTTVELVFIAILGVVFGIVNNLIGIVYTGINAVNPTAALFFAPFGIVTLLAAYVVRKPGSSNSGRCNQWARTIPCWQSCGSLGSRIWYCSWLGY